MDILGAIFPPTAGIDLRLARFSVASLCSSGAGLEKMEGEIKREPGALAGSGLNDDLPRLGWLERPAAVVVSEEDMALKITGGTVEDEDEIRVGDEGQRRRGGQIVSGGEKAGEL